MERQPQEKKKDKTRIVLIIGIIAALLVLAAVVVLGITGEKREENREPDIEESIYGDEYLGIDPRVDEELLDYRNVVLFGIDEDETEGNVQLSDDFIIVSFDKNTEEMKLISIDGDTSLKIEEGSGKVSSAYSTGGIDGVIRTLNRNLDLNIREGVALPWTMIEELVDKIGGIELQAADGTMQTMNGQQAVSYARAETAEPLQDPADGAAGGSTDPRPMQTVLMAALHKAKTMESDEVVPILDEVMPQVIQRSMNRDQVSALLLDMSVKDPAANILWPYEAAGGTEGALMPQTLQSNVVRLHGELFGQSNYDPTDFVKEAQ